ncbi:beta-N-acetylhexosaminidase [Qipengyuania marisflavi]|uniref:beta-N-acetylhexosaminidase n=1 Tax=Qipengyuania marisflavi TaxID=2486356 RepID=A0A5S3PC03_9SPHN|nr:beta-N-acetylhexosaminidase [Qipengyuania marisflavi]TMM48769.1 beta-N-acetylhexosaminidase [Qipengyuania marisflavi]
MIPAIFGISGDQLTKDERAFFKDADPAGYILFGRNCVSRDQMRALTDDLCSLHGRDRNFISIDQEGGRVARMKPPEWSAFPAGAAFDALYQIAPASAIEAARINAEALARELAEVGVTVDFHPPLDIPQPGAHDVIGDRALGHEPMQVAALGRAILNGFSRAGVLGCIKHMPGHGRSTADTHKEMPTVTASAAELARDIAPFKTLAGTPLGMTGHLLFTAWDAENPVTHSPAIIHDIIRGEIGFGGLLLTDDIDMEALSGSIPERSERALAAGCDVVLNCWAKMDDMIGIAQRCPAMRGDSIARYDRAMAALGAPPTSFETGELLAKRDALLAITEEATA